MNDWSGFLEQMDWMGLILFLVSGLACLLCITLHELSHGYVAYRLGDPTAKLNGRLTLNPIPHIDPIGLLMMLTVRVGWAKPVPVDMRNFRVPKRDMAITALAGPVSNLLTALVALGLGSLLYHFAPEHVTVAWAILFLSYVAVLSVGLGLFNLIPIPPLDGSKILFSCLPDRAYLTILRYERFVILAVVVLSWAGILSRPLSLGMEVVIGLLCRATQFPFQLLMVYGFF